MVKSSTHHNLHPNPNPGAAGTSAIIRVMLSNFGLRKTMLIKAGIDAVVLGTAYLLIKERRKPSTTIIWYDKKFLTDPTFWSIILCLCMANFGYPAPFFYLPTFAKQKIPNLSELVSIPSYGVLASQGDLIYDSFPSSPSPLLTYRRESGVAAPDSWLIGLGLQTPCFSSS
jgi:hypothetical protein